MRISSLNLVLLVVVGSVLLTQHVLTLGVLDLENLWLLLFAATMVLSSRPIVIKLGSNFSVFSLLIIFKDEWMLKKIGPGQSLVWSLIKEALQERFEIWGHIVWEFDRVLDNQVNQGIN